MLHTRATTTGNQTFIGFKFDGKLTVTECFKPNPGAECQKRTITVDVPKAGGIMITVEIGEPDRIEFMPGSTPPDGFKKIC